MSKASIRQPLIITFTYDYANRRVGKRVQEKAGGQWLERYHHLYVYNGTQPVAEIDASTRRVLRTFAWGATGELLMIHDRTIPASPQTYLPVRDASGSVTALVRDDGNSTAIVAVYEYDPNGNLLRAQGEYAKKNPFTFGGGWMDWETGLVSAGSVYYSARLGRYINSGPSGAGDGISACFGVDPSISYHHTRQYARPSSRRSISTPSWQSVNPAELAAYEAAWTAYETARVAYEQAAEAESMALDGERSHNPDCESPEDNTADEFIADEHDYHQNAVFDSRDHGLSDAYLIGTDHREGGAYIEYYSDGSMLVTNTLGSTLLIENDGTATLNFSAAQLEIMQAPVSGYLGGSTEAPNTTTASQSTVHKTRSFKNDIFERYEKGKHKGQLKFVHTANGSERTQDGKKIEYQVGYLTTMDGVQVTAYKNKNGGVAWETNCHGYSVADGMFWIAPADMTHLLNNTNLLAKVTGDPSAGDIAVYLRNNEAIHSARYVGDKGISYADGNRIFENKTRINVSKNMLYHGITPVYYRRKQ